MSSVIFYDIKAVRIPANAVNAAEDVYVLCFLQGSSNTYAYNGQRERKWCTPFIGTFDDVMAHQISWLRYTFYWKTYGRSGEVPEYLWLTKIRKALESAEVMVEIIMDDGSMQVGELTFKPYRLCDGMTIRQALCSSMERRAQSNQPGYSDWDVFRITGPGQN